MEYRIRKSIEDLEEILEGFLQKEFCDCAPMEKIKLKRIQPPEEDDIYYILVLELEDTIKEMSNDS